MLSPRSEMPPMRCRIQRHEETDKSDKNICQSSISPCAGIVFVCSAFPSFTCRANASCTRMHVFSGSLIQVPMSEKGKITRGRLGSLSLKKEGEKQCFLFSKHLIICTRGSGGKLHLTKVKPRALHDTVLKKYILGKGGIKKIYMVGQI